MKKFLTGIFIAAGFLFAFSEGDSLIFNITSYSTADIYSALATSSILGKIEAKVVIKYKNTSGDSILLLARILNIETYSAPRGAKSLRKTPVKLPDKEIGIVVKKDMVYYLPYNIYYYPLLDGVMYSLLPTLLKKSDGFTYTKTGKYGSLYIRSEVVTHEGEREKVLYSGRNESVLRNPDKNEVISQRRLKYHMLLDRDVGRDIPLNGWMNYRFFEVTRQPMVGKVTIDGEVYTIFELEE